MPQETPADRAKVLLVDDESSNLEFLCALLQHEYNITVAKSGAQALARAAADPPPDVIVLDILMPEMDGYEVCRRLKADERTRDIPVIFVTALDGEADEEKGFALGAVDYASKPFRPAVVRARIASHVRLRRTQRELELEQRRIRTLFGRFVDPKLVDSLLRTPDESILLARHEQVSVLFADIEGFTSLSEHRTPAELFSILGRILTELTEEILALEGTLDKYIGDAILAFWGAPMAQPDHARRAVQAAFRMSRRAAELGLTLGGGPKPIGLRIGIATGPVAVGGVGSQLRCDYTVIGDTVNLASRLESANRYFHTRVLVSDRTRAEAGEGLAMRTIGPVRVAGREGIERIHEVLIESDSASYPWLSRYESAYRSLEMADSQAAIQQLAGLIVDYDDRVIRALLDRALRMRDHHAPLVDHYYDLVTK
ncbi:MAG: response regulator [Candidatus Wallbacteria bacterium]|nr:response regulator [Candidatus Wallbacteria bacterium]